MNIIRVFPRRTSYTPTDDMAFVGDPPLIRPEAEEIHVSVTFTWDIPEGRRLQKAWRIYYPVVRLDGPAFNNNSIFPFIPGMYVKPGITFTTRGCNRRCPWCLVPKREGRLKEIRHFASGYIIQDNNLLQASQSHIAGVFNMLRVQPRAAIFAGGLQNDLINDWFVEQLRSIRLNCLFLAADTREALKSLGKALMLLSFLDRRKLRVYCMIGFNESVEMAKDRLQAIWDMGGMPFAQLYQPPDQYIQYSPEWRALARKWMRPAIMMTNPIDEMEDQYQWILC